MTPPRLNFTYNGAESATNLSSTADNVYADYGSTWRVDRVLGGSNSTERWVASTGNTNGTALTSETVSLEYFHQYAVTFSFVVNDGSTPSSLPIINFTSAGAPTIQSLNKTKSTFWADAATSYSYSSMINHNASEKWIVASGTSGKISHSTFISAYYYHQFLVSVVFSVSGGGASYSAPVFTFKTLGAISNGTMQLQPVAYWLDANSTWTAPKLLIGSSTSERWSLVNSTGTGGEMLPRPF